METKQSEKEKENLSFGEKAVGLRFNPSNNDSVGQCKKGFADLIDQMNNFRNQEGISPDAKRHASVAITEMESAQMRAVKALSWS